MEEVARAIQEAEVAVLKAFMQVDTAEDARHCGWRSRSLLTIRRVSESRNWAATLTLLGQRWTPSRCKTPSSDNLFAN